MRKNLLASFCLIFACIAALPDKALGQGNISVLFDGMALVGKTNFLKDSGKLNRMKSKSAVFPGVEARFNQDGRVTLGVSYQHWQLEQDPTRVSFPVWRGGVQKIVSWDESSDATGNIVLATVYVNLVTQGRVRPFVGGGPGFGSFRVSSRIQNIIDTNPPFFDPDFYGSGSREYTESQMKLMVKGVAGLNIYPAKHLVLSLGGGYINGPAVNFGAGFTF